MSSRIKCGQCERKRITDDSKGLPSSPVSSLKSDPLLLRSSSTPPCPPPRPQRHLGSLGFIQDPLLPTRLLPPLPGFALQSSEDPSAHSLTQSVHPPHGLLGSFSPYPAQEFPSRLLSRQVPGSSQLGCSLLLLPGAGPAPCHTTLLFPLTQLPPSLPSDLSWSITTPRKPSLTCQSS